MMNRCEKNENLSKLEIEIEIEIEQWRPKETGETRQTRLPGYLVSYIGYPDPNFYIYYYYM